MMRVIATACAALIGITSAALAADLAGSSDHPLLSRYGGAEIVGYAHKAFDEYTGIAGAAGGQGGYGALVDFEGSVTRILYAAPRGRSTLEIFRNYQAALADAGFDIRFSCKEDECGPGFFTYLQPVWPEGWIRDVYVVEPLAQRYLAAVLDRPEGRVGVFLHVSEHTFLNSIARPYVHVDIVEEAAMETNVVRVDPTVLAGDIERQGHVAVDGIFFDTGSAALRPESGDALAAVAQLLADRPSLALHVVGHTDSVGEFDDNLDLSRRRAAAVVAALVEGFAIDPARLTANGVGALAPVASNRSPAGRALNRRVELVERP